MLTEVKSFRQAVQQSAEGYPLLGWAICWTISGVQISYPEFCAILDSVGIDPKWAAPVRPKSALLRAIKEETKTKKLFHRNVVDNAERAGFAIVGTHSVDQEAVDVQFQTETKVILDKKSQSIEIDGDHAQEIEQAFHRFSETYTSDLFRTVVLKLVKHECKGFSYRDRGGVYFIPATEKAAFEKLQALFEHFPECALEPLPIIDTAQAKKTMWKAFVSEANEEMAKFKEDLAKLDADAGAHSIQIRLNRFAALKDRVEAYEFLLSGTAQDLKTELDNLSAALKAKLVEG